MVAFFFRRSASSEYRVRMAFALMQSSAPVESSSAERAPVVRAHARALRHAIRIDVEDIMPGGQASPSMVAADHDAERETFGNA